MVALATVFDAAKRELFEEAGAVDYDVKPLCDYWIYAELEGKVLTGNGQVYFANVYSLTDIPSESEMEMICLFDAPPKELTYLTTYQLLPIKRTTELLKDLFGVDISQGTIVASGAEAYGRLAETEGRVKEEVAASEVAGFDETGMRVMGKNHWLHAASTEACTVYSIHPKRGKEAMDAMGILPRFGGTAIHDHLRCYYQYLCAHGECNQHHLRQLQYIGEDLGCGWAMEMLRLLLRVKKHVDLTRLFNEEASSLGQEDIEGHERAYREILEEAQEGMEKAPLESQRMIRRLAQYEQEALLFMQDFSVPFTNNLTERDLRMPKAKQKISGGFRTRKGADIFARVRGFVSTVKKRGMNVWDGMAAVFKGEALGFLYPEP